MNNLISFFHISNNFHFLVYIGLLFLISQTFGRIANFLKSPHIVGYLLAGLIFGPSLLNLFSQKLITKDLSIIMDITLSIIAFSIGGSLRLNILKQFKKSILWITFLQAIGAFILVFVFTAILMPTIITNVEAQNGFEKTYLPIALILGAISLATAPAPILSVIHEYKAKKGSFTNILLGIVTIDDAIALFFYSFAMVICKGLISGESLDLAIAFFEPIISIILAITLGFLMGLFLKIIIKFFKPKDLLLGIITGAVLLTGGLAITLKISSLLANMTLGFFVANFIEHKRADEAFDVIDGIEEPIFGIFFLIAGAQLDMKFLSKGALLTGILLVSRFLGKYFGTYLGSFISHSPNFIKKYLGLSLFPTAGVSIGLVLEADVIFSKTLPYLSDLMVNAIIGVTLINELISPYFVRFSLKKAKEI
jgi:Kef-type K+ transport system membrane component KefB